MRRIRLFKAVVLMAAALLTTVLAFSRPQVKKLWSPTKTPANTSFIGKQACAECHADKFKSHAQTTMGRAMEMAAAAEILSKNPKLTFRNGPYSYEIARQGERVMYTVTVGKETISVPVLYAFGLGHAGQTYILQGEEGFYESRVSFYNKIGGLDTTIGQSTNTPLSLTDALGRLMPRDETLQCFSCHTTGAVKGGKLTQQDMVPGIGCETCHGPGTEHVALGRKGEPNKQKIFNPAHLSGDDLNQEFCAACHRSVEDVIGLPRLGGLNNVRFQPYRIFNSKCYSDDRRISCIGCHDVHEPLKQEAAYYDTKCLACHKTQESTATRFCKVATKNCTSCHMPKIDLPGAHTTFTDHRIRIVKAGEPYPL